MREDTLQTRKDCGGGREKEREGGGKKGLDGVDGGEEERERMERMREKKKRAKGRLRRPCSLVFSSFVPPFAQVTNGAGAWPSAVPPVGPWPSKKGVPGAWPDPDWPRRHVHASIPGRLEATAPRWGHPARAQKYYGRAQQYNGRAQQHHRRAQQYRRRAHRRRHKHQHETPTPPIPL